MQRRSFIKQSVLWTAGCAVGSRMPLWGAVDATGEVTGAALCLCMTMKVWQKN